MTYETFIRAMRIIKHAITYLRLQRGSGNCQDAIARNRAIKTLNDAEWRVISGRFK